jgi:hypothetical protein
MHEMIKKADNATLWALVSDVAAVMEQRGYTPDQGNNAFMFWYEVYKELEAEINSRLVIDFMEE